ncbi:MULTISPECIES: hypothetical protein [Ramlibacter]|uniref:PilC beta-propeller domain-containing protein n=1 Tax=Ramlibacter aquaticus TaxID=2780094 RepID=A0ABR9SIH0_9BURK|nr:MULTISPECIES: hypothetical protein [Ramlibacter]MBE7941969.1 hypothetical protein [Ramlibacter aquaticus]
MKFLRLLLTLALLLGLAPLAQAEDIDLFTGASSGSTAASNLLIVMDNAAHASSNSSIPGSTCTIGGATNTLSGTAQGVEQCVLYKVIDALPVTATATINVGIMVYNGSGVAVYNAPGVTATLPACSSTGEGGCLVYPLTGLTTATKPYLLNYILNWQSSNGNGNQTTGGSYWIKANKERTGASMQESWAYYAGRMGLSGTSYASLVPSTNCKNFILFLADASNTSSTPGDSPGNAGPQSALEGTNIAAKNANPAAIVPSQTNVISSTAQDQVTSCGTLTKMPQDHNGAGYYADEWARYMHASNLKITSYSIALVNPGSCFPDIPWVLSSVANWGGGKYFSTTDASSLTAAMTAVFSEVRSVNSVFAAVSLPVSTVNQNNFLNQIFIGMFRPDSNFDPRWYGNLKQYRAAYVNGVLQTVDADGTAAVASNGSEFIQPCARSYWTPTALDAYWSTYTDANCPNVTTQATSNTPDGQVVEKGGQGYMLRASSPATRTVTTCSTTFNGCNTLTQFTTSNSALTTTVFGLTDSTQLSNLINWTRGQNVLTEDVSTVATSTSMRPSAHGGVVHSRPAAFNFGTDTNRQVVVLYGGDDGVFRAVNGNRTDTFTVGGSGGATVQAGSEFWSFVAPESYGMLQRIYYDNTVISGSNPKPYGMDGPITAYKASNGDGWVFAGMRRGGRALYSFKIDATTLGISLRWKRGCGDYTTSNCTSSAYGDWTNIGQTWGTPHVFTTSTTTGTTNTLVVMGGGYDATCEDAYSYSCSSTTGNRIYVFDASGGSITATFTTTRSVTADVTIATDSSGNAMYIYANDLAGNIYRISGPLSNGAYTSIGSNPASSWVISTIATLGCDVNLLCGTTPNRKLMFAPEVVFDGTSYIVLTGSGDREKPTNTNNPTTNYFFAIKDRPDAPSLLSKPLSCGLGTTGLCLAALYTFPVGTTPDPAQIASSQGYAIQMRTNEQVITAASAVFGTVYFSTHLPKPNASNSCSVNLGDLTPRSFQYATGAGTDVYTTRSDAGLSPDPVVGNLMLDNGTVVPVCIGCAGPLQTSQLTAPGSVSNPAKIRSFWYIRK